MSYPLGVVAGDLLVPQSSELIEGVGDRDRRDAGVELLGPCEAVGTGEAVGECEKVGEVPAFGTVQDGQDLPGCQVLGRQHRQSVDLHHWEQRGRVHSQIDIYRDGSLPRDEAGEGLVRSGDLDRPSRADPPASA